MNLFEDNNNGAAFSPCRKYRYALWRVWDSGKPLVMFIGSNPSTANETKTDATIRRVKKFAETWGYGGFYMMNLFAIVSRYPAVLKTDPDPLGDNDGWIEKIAEKCDKVIFAWGNFKEAEERSKDVIKMFPDAYALEINKNGSPKHPLYVSKDIELVKYNALKSELTDNGDKVLADALIEQLDKWIIACESQATDFFKRNMEISEAGSLGMKCGYIQVRSLILNLTNEISDKKTD